MGGREAEQRLNHSRSALCHCQWISMAMGVLAALASGAQGAFNISNTLGDNMVLQREPKQAVVWGFGSAGVAVTPRSRVSSLQCRPPQTSAHYSAPLLLADARTAPLGQARRCRRPRSTPLAALHCIGRS